MTGSSVTFEWLRKNGGTRSHAIESTVLRHAFGESESREKIKAVTTAGVSNARLTYGLLPDGTFRPNPTIEVEYARAIAGPGACPTCYLRDGFHDHGEAYSRHDAYRVPGHLVRVSNSAVRRQRRAERATEDPRLGAIY